MLQKNDGSPFLGGQHRGNVELHRALLLPFKPRCREVRFDAAKAELHNLRIERRVFFVVVVNMKYARSIFVIAPVFE